MRHLTSSAAPAALRRAGPTPAHPLAGLAAELGLFDRPRSATLEALLNWLERRL